MKITKLFLSVLFAFGLIATENTMAQDNTLEVGYRRIGRVDADAFKLDKASTVQIEGTGGLYERLGNDVLFYGWILDAKTRKVVWSLLDEENDRYFDYRRADGRFRFDTEIELQAGEYEVYYAAGLDNNNENNFNLGDVFDWIFSGDDRREYENNKRFSRYSMTLTAVDTDFTPIDLYDNLDSFAENTIFSVMRAGDNELIRKSFKVEKEVDLNIYGVGEQYAREQFDFAWILDAKTYEKVWPTKMTRFEKAGGGKKNKMVSEIITLPEGEYTLIYVTDDSHSYDHWNVLPPYDPQSWGISIWVEGKDERHIGEAEKSDHFSLKLTKARDDDYMSQAFKLEKDMDVRIYSIGERANRGDMADYGWIINMDNHEKVWEFKERYSEYAGGADKNRMINEEIRLEEGNYIAYYVTDGSHSYRDWNDSPPMLPHLYGLIIYAEENEYFKLTDAEDIKDKNLVSQILRIRNNDYERQHFTLEEDTKVRIYAIGEGDGGDMYDYGWIKDRDTGRIVWEMTYRKTEHAGGARKNRMFDGTILLPKGDYTLYFESDGSHSYRSWNSSAPHDQENYGISVYFVNE